LKLLAFFTDPQSVPESQEGLKRLGEGEVWPHRHYADVESQEGLKRNPLYAVGAKWAWAASPTQVLTILT